jgi:hypothetical protein
VHGSAIGDTALQIVHWDPSARSLKEHVFRGDPDAELSRLSARQPIPPRAEEEPDTEPTDNDRRWAREQRAAMQAHIAEMRRQHTPSHPVIDRAVPIDPSFAHCRATRCSHAWSS